MEQYLAQGVVVRGGGFTRGGWMLGEGDLERKSEERREEPGKGESRNATFGRSVGFLLSLSLSFSLSLSATCLFSLESVPYHLSFSSLFFCAAPIITRVARHPPHGGETRGEGAASESASVAMPSSPSLSSTSRWKPPKRRSQ
eukprot:scaffold145282_cov23-Tisochrysis_lutea.AAC.1